MQFSIRGRKYPENMRSSLAALVFHLGWSLSADACLWDRDTPADEAKGLPEVVAVLTGRFERNPPLFYEMRLERVAAHLQSHPDDLAAYDDAGVACDRLGQGDQAISWMERKLVQLETSDPSRPEVKEQRYRYHANLGTFLVHRWVRQGADRARIDEVKAARDEIAKALAINPKAHFGREKYQLRALNWIVDPPKTEALQDLPNVLGWNFGDIYGQQTDPHEADDAVRGLAGLIVLGNAWESVDIFHALNVALQRDSLGFERGREGGRNTLAYLAWLRCRELVDTGKGSFLPDAPKGEDLKSLLPRPDFVSADLLLDSAFLLLRADSDAWHAARTAFMTKRLKAGQHPDTYPGFWDGYKERSRPSLPTMSVPDAFYARQALRQRIALSVVIGVPVLALLAAGLLAVRRARARRLKAHPVKDTFAELG
jgi:tetratricopeptide (TPR) repeat protein